MEKSKETKSVHLTVRVTPADKKAIESAAAAADRTRSEYIRLAALSAAGMSNRLASPSAVAGGHGAVMAGAESVA